MIISPSLYPLIAALLANVAAQVLKLFNFYFRSGRWDLHQVISCGGFPSSHSSTVTALSLAIGLQEGFTSPFFAITCIFAFIVIYDAGQRALLCRQEHPADQTAHQRYRGDAEGQLLRSDLS